MNEAQTIAYLLHTAHAAILALEAIARMAATVVSDLPMEFR